MNFEESIAALKKKQAVVDPVAAARAALEPTKVDCVKALREFEEIASRVPGVLADAITKYQKAAAVGVRYDALAKQISETDLLRTGGREAFREMIIAIDRLDDYAVGQRYHLQYPTLVKMRRSNIGALREAIAHVERHSQVLDQLVREAAANGNGNGAS